MKSPATILVQGLTGEGRIRGEGQRKEWQVRYIVMGAEEIAETDWRVVRGEGQRSKGNWGQKREYEKRK